MLDETHNIFRHEAWLNAYPLNRETTLVYFKYSPFYDATCDNEQLEAQGRSLAELPSLTGIQYELETNPNIAPINDCAYVVRKVKRLGQDRTALLSLYYVLAVDLPFNPLVGRYELLPKGSVFAMPDLNAVILFNISASVYHLSSAMKSITQHVTEARGAKDDVVASTSAGAAQTSAAAAAAAASSSPDSSQGAGTAGVARSALPAPPVSRESEAIFKEALASFVEVLAAPAPAAASAVKSEGLS